MEFELRYHVPRSQVWQGSRGAQKGHTHLHVTEAIDWGRLKRSKGQALCGKRGWYERPPEFESEKADICPRCADLADRYKERADAAQKPS